MYKMLYVHGVELKALSLWRLRDARHQDGTVSDFLALLLSPLT